MSVALSASRMCKRPVRKRHLPGSKGSDIELRGNYFRGAVRVGDPPICKSRIEALTPLNPEFKDEDGIRRVLNYTLARVAPPLIRVSDPRKCLSAYSKYRKKTGRLAMAKRNTLRMPCNSCCGRAPPSNNRLRLDRKSAPARSSRRLFSGRGSVAL